MRSRLLVATLATALVATPIVASISSASATASPESAKIKKAKYRMLLTFDQRGSFKAGTRIQDASRHRHGGVVMVQAPGRVTKSNGAHGHAANMPNRGRAVIEVADGRGLDPGRRNFTFGASVRATKGQTVHGSNVMQKGYFNTDGGQYKLQLDPGGIPACVFFGSKGRVKATASVGVANNKWHRLACVRGKAGLTVRVDGKIRGFVPGQVGFVSNAAPVRIGAKKLNSPNKQFKGVVDNAYLRFLPAT